MQARCIALMGFRVTEQENYFLLRLHIVISSNPQCPFINFPIISQRNWMHLPYKTLKNVILAIWVLRHAVKYINLFIITVSAVSVRKIIFSQYKNPTSLIISLSLSGSYQQGCGATEELPAPFSKNRKRSTTSEVRSHTNVFDLQSLKFWCDKFKL